jgi:DNA repair exonuclease SbcCD ATPase subunit
VNIRSLKLHRFMSHKATELVIPDRGVVLVTGSNGSGKSSIVEGIAAALWGKSVRGAPPWQEGKDGLAEIVTDLVRATRQRTKAGKTSLTWSVGIEIDGEQFETTTKGQDALEQIVGSFDVWQRTAVFSSSDAAHFTLATDAERKRLLESVLGLDRFDVALDACRMDQKAAVARAQETSETKGKLEGEVRTAEELGARAKKELAECPPEADPTPLKAHRATLGAELVGTAQRSDASREAVQAAERALGHVQGELASYQRALRAATTAKVCPTCRRPLEVGQTVTPEPPDVDEAGCQEALTAAQGVHKANKLAHLAVTGRIQDLDAKLGEIERSNSAREKLRKELTTLEKRLKKAQGAAFDMEEAHEQAMYEVALLATVSQVLGLKGVRATVLSRTLGGIEEIANGWLNRIAGPGLTLNLSELTEKKTGGYTDAISLEVHGAGGGHGYRAASGGERRRIDVALLFALAEVSAAALGRSPGTLFFDEVFDALDPEGVEAVVGCLSDLAQERAVLVVSHSAEFASKLAPVQRWKVEQGNVTVV